RLATDGHRAVHRVGVEVAVEVIGPGLQRRDVVLGRRDTGHRLALEQLFRRGRVGEDREVVRCACVVVLERDRRRLVRREGQRRCVERETGRGDRRRGTTAGGRSAGRDRQGAVHRGRVYLAEEVVLAFGQG